MNWLSLLFSLFSSSNLKPAEGEVMADGNLPALPGKSLLTVNDVAPAPTKVKLWPKVNAVEDKIMRTSMRGALEILAHEAIVLNRYRDTKGIWTIGVGVTSASKASINPDLFSGTITAVEAYDLFREILPKYEDMVNKSLAGRKVKQHEYDALVSLSYNAGNIAKPLTMAKIASGDVAGAIDLWRADRVLWSRRNKEVKLAKTGQYPSEFVTVYTADNNGIVNRRSGKRVPLIEFASGGGGSW